MNLQTQIVYSKIPGFEEKRIEIITVPTFTFEGIKQAEQMKAKGWIQGIVSLFSTQYYRFTDPTAHQAYK